MSATSPSAICGIRFGAAYYAEYEQNADIERDFDLMVGAGFTVIRVGESVWSTWEPRDGEFTLEWLLPILDAAHQRGIGVILGTATYAVPPWLQKKHPEIAADRGTGIRANWGGRQEVDYSSPVFLRYAERLVRTVVERYVGHPAVIGFQVDNEPGLELFHNAGAFERFVQQLEQTYGTVDALNREWGLTYWSHRIDRFNELWVPDGNTLPQYDLAWRRFQAQLTTEFITWQAEIVREYSRADQFVTTCIAYPRPALDDVKLAVALDVTAANSYYGMQDHLAIGHDLQPITPWSTTGVWGLYRQADRVWSSKQSRFLITETNAQSIGGSDHNYPPYPGQLRLAALAFVSRGAAMIEYWHWHTLAFGTETYWGGVLPHSGRPGRVYREVAEIGTLLGALGTSLDGYVPDADVTLLYSTDSKFAMAFQPPLRTAGGSADRSSYEHIFDAFYRGVIQAGAQARIVHANQLGSDAAAFAVSNPVLVVPGLYIATDSELQFLRDYAVFGGHVILGPRTGYADDEARARAAVAPAFLAEKAGSWYEEFNNLDSPLTLTAPGAFALSPDARATSWVDGLIVDSAEVLACYEHAELGRFPAITSREVGAGRITLVGTVPNAALARDIVRFAVPTPLAAVWDASPAVTIASGTTPDGRRTWFVSNWSSDPATAAASEPLANATGVDRFVAGHKFSLEPWASEVLISE